MDTLEGQPLPMEGEPPGEPVCVRELSFTLILQQPAELVLTQSNTPTEPAPHEAIVRVHKVFAGWLAPGSGVVRR